MHLKCGFGVIEGHWNFTTR